MTTLTRNARVAERLRAYDTATIYEANGRRGAFEPGIVTQLAGSRVAGPARTAVCAPGDNLALHQAVATAEAGEILVAHSLDGRTGVWGEVLTIAAIERGVAALVIDGAVRDIDAIRALGFPIFARGTALTAANKVTPGALGLPIPCGGQLVRPGDWVVADDSGVAVIADAQVEAALAAAAERSEFEERITAGLRSGSTTVELLGLDAPSHNPNTEDPTA